MRSEFKICFILIHFQNISFSYLPDKQVLNKVSFSLDKGKTLAIVGVSGCGKSTLLRIIAGILPGNKYLLEGNITVCGKTPDAYRQMGKLSFMFQEPTLMPNLTVKENITLPLKVKSVKDTRDVNDLIATVGLEEAKNYLPKQLSGGMKTRVALARSYVTFPELLLLDEPFSALDIGWKSRLYVELEKLKEITNTTIIIVTHDVQEALLLADHVIVLNFLGFIETAKDIVSNFSILERVSNISGYMNSVYERYLLPVQDAIMNGKTIEYEK